MTPGCGLTGALHSTCQMYSIHTLSLRGVSHCCVPFRSHRGTVDSIGNGLTIARPKRFNAVLFANRVNYNGDSRLTQVSRRRRRSFLIIRIRISRRTSVGSVRCASLCLVVVGRIRCRLQQLGVQFSTSLLGDFRG